MIEIFYKKNLLLGESPIWDDEQKILYWLDILEKKIFAYKNKTFFSFKNSFYISSIGLTNFGNLICTTAKGIMIINPFKNKYKLIYPRKDFIHETSSNRFNDGKIDYEGNYVFGSMDKNEKKKTGNLYRIKSKKIEILDKGFVICNGPAFSRYKKKMYFSDSINRKIYVYNYDPKNNKISNKKVFSSFNDEDGCPDGLTVDAEDCLWCAVYGGSRIQRYSSDGKIIKKVHLPVTQVTSCTFGGEENNIIFITTASQGQSSLQKKKSLSGNIFSIKTSYKGVGSNRYIEEKNEKI